MTKELSALSIGALSTATGIPVETLRTWERRYGFPRSERNVSGHRIYPASAVEHLRQVSHALARGYRPSHLGRLSAPEIAQLLERTGAATQSPSQPWLETWMEAIFKLDRRRFEGFLRTDWLTMGALDFLRERIHPFLVGVGERWEDGLLSVRHEHFASECVRDFLSSQWRALTELYEGPQVVFANLPGEDHNLSLHMAALVCALTRMRVLFLGGNTPVEDIAQAAQDETVMAVVTSVWCADDKYDCQALVRELRERLDPQVHLVYGGSGASRIAVEGAIYLRSMDDLYQWARERRALHAQIA